MDDYRAPEPADWKERMRAYLKEESESGDVILSEKRTQRLKEFLASQRFKGLVLAAFRRHVDAEKPGFMDVGRLEVALRSLQSTLQADCLKQVLLLPTDFHAEDAQHDVRFTTEELAEWLLSIGQDPRQVGHITLGEFHFLAQTMVFTLVTLHRVHSIAARKRSEALRPTLGLAAATLLATGAFYLVQLKRKRNAKPPPMPAALRAKLSLPGSAGSTGGLLPHSSRVLPVFQDGQAAGSDSRGQSYMDEMTAPGQAKHRHDDGYDAGGDDDEAVGVRRPSGSREPRGGHGGASRHEATSPLVAPIQDEKQTASQPRRQADWLERQALSRAGGGSRASRRPPSKSGVDPSDC